MLKIQVFSDVICPWCLVGKRRLERALDELGLRAGTAITWLPFELNPDMPEGGMPRAEYRARKFGPERAASLDADMIRLGREDGIAFRFDRQARTPSTRLAHIALAYAAAHDRQNELKEALMTAYFEGGADVGDPAVLIDLAAGIGLDRDAVTAALADPTLRRQVVATEARAAELGIGGVPFFIVDEAWAMSGAQPSEAWVAALREKGLASAA